jgi:hypothetical protein
MRKKNSKRALPPYIAFVQSYHRKRVETAGSLIEQLLPKSIRNRSRDLSPLCLPAAVGVAYDREP